VGGMFAPGEVNGEGLFRLKYVGTEDNYEESRERYLVKDTGFLKYNAYREIPERVREYLNENGIECDSDYLSVSFDCLE
jgi:small-conductance mechanosensitive channel